MLDAFARLEPADEDDVAAVAHRIGPRLPPTKRPTSTPFGTIS